MNDMQTYSKQEHALESAEEEAYAAEEFIAVEIGPEGASMEVDDPSGNELLALGIFSAAVVAGIFAWRRHKR